MPLDRARHLVCEVVMNRPRIDLGFESSSVTLNLQIASQIGQELASARAASTLSIDTIASRLVMSKGQIRALERADPDVFYNAKFHAAGLRKYAELLRVQPEGLDRVLIDPNAFDDDEAEDESADRPIESAFHRAHMALAGRSLLEVVPRPSKPVALTAAALVTVAVLSLLVRSIVAEAPVEPVEPVATMARVQPSVTQLPIRSGPIPATGAAFSVARLARPARLDVPRLPVAEESVGHVRVGHATWVFVRYEDNSIVETVLAAGQQMALDDRPIYVAVGAADGAEVVIGDTPIDPTGLVVDGELRIGSARLRDLTATLQ